MVHFMSTSYRPEVSVICFPEEPEPLMNENVVYKKVGHPVNGNSQANPEKVIIAGLHPKEKSCDTGNGENEKEKIVVLKETLRLLVVMIFVQRPQQTVHDIFMSEPGHAFHSEECGQNNENIKYD